VGSRVAVAGVGPGRRSGAVVLGDRQHGRNPSEWNVAQPYHPASARWQGRGAGESGAARQWCRARSGWGTRGRGSELDRLRRSGRWQRRSGWCSAAAGGAGAAALAAVRRLGDRYVEVTGPGIELSGGNGPGNEVSRGNVCFLTSVIFLSVHQRSDVQVFIW
jgi:hypothetical protein